MTGLELDWVGLGCLQHMGAHSVVRFPAGVRGLEGLQAKWGEGGSSSVVIHSWK